MKIDKKQHDALMEQKNKAVEALNQIEAQLKEAVLEDVHEPQPGDVYDQGGEICLLVDGTFSGYYEGQNVILSSYLGESARPGRMNRSEFKDKKFLGKFEDVYITKEQLEDNFNTMKDDHKDLWREGTPFIIKRETENFEKFIDNLFNNRNVDGSEKE